MPRSREEFQEHLEKDILGNENVYFQPPSNTEMSYPAIRYDLARLDNIYANNAVYQQHTAYECIVIDKDPDSEIVKKLSFHPLCRWLRRYKADNLNHDVFLIYY